MIKSVKSLFRQFFDMLALFTPREKRDFRILLFILLVNSLIEMAGVGAISPLLNLSVNTGDPTGFPLSQISRLTGASGQTLLIIIAVGFIVLTLLRNLFSLFTFSRTTQFYTRIYRSLSARLLKNYLSKDFIWFLNKNSSDFPRLIIQEVNYVARSIIYNLLLILTNGILALGLLVLLSLQNVLVAAAMILLLGSLYALLYVFFKTRLKFLGIKRFRLDQERFTLLNNLFGGIKQVKIREKEAFFRKKYEDNAFEFSRTTVRSEVYGVAPRYAVETIIFSLFGGVILYIHSRGANIGDILPSLSLYAFAAYRLLPTLQKISKSVNTVVSNMESFRKLKSDLLTDISPSPASSPEEEALTGEIRLNHISYTYPGTDLPVLRDFDLAIGSHEKLGIVGFSGSGKTTLLNIIMGLLQPSSGEFSVNGVPIDRDSLSRWRKSLGLVSQDVYLLDGTVAENIAFGEEPGRIDRKRMEEAAGMAEIHKTILAMERGYETEVGERGMKLSGGQAQRIVIARALYHQPDVLIFDEATSAMDNLTEKAIMESLDRLSGMKTLIIVAHRLTTVKDCDRIILLRDGRIINEGTYASLMEKDPDFRHLAMESDT
jgi:ATP-binding cassette, subfamily B, bacterial PglK